MQRNVYNNEVCHSGSSVRGGPKKEELFKEQIGDIPVLQVRNNKGFPEVTKQKGFHSKGILR